SEMEEIMMQSLRINDYLSGLFHGIGLKLIDFRIEFGRIYEDDDVRIVLANDITPDNCRLWDLKTNEKMDIDRFREDLGRVEEAYQEVARRLGLLVEDNNPPLINLMQEKNDESKN
ncbi:MAG: phosphoribosylaminoimidazolesuccinocarboxamide synthase, partial [Bdellovibrionales bacterium]